MPHYSNQCMAILRLFNILQLNNKLICSNLVERVNNLDQFLHSPSNLIYQEVIDQCLLKLENQSSRDKITHLEKVEDWDTLVMTMIK